MKCPHCNKNSTVYVGNLKGVGRIYQQTFTDTYSKVDHGKLYVSKTPVTASDLLNERVLPFYESRDLPILRILTDRGTPSFVVEWNSIIISYILLLMILSIRKQKPCCRKQTASANVFTKQYCKSFIKLLSVKSGIVTLKHHNQLLIMCCGRTPIETLLDRKRIWAEKNLTQI